MLVAKPQMCMVWEVPEGFGEFPYGWEVPEMKYEKATAEVIRFSPIEFMLISMGGWRCDAVRQWPNDILERMIEIGYAGRVCSDFSYSPSETYWNCNDIKYSNYPGNTCFIFNPDLNFVCEWFSPTHS